MIELQKPTYCCSIRAMVLSVMFFYPAFSIIIIALGFPAFCLSSSLSIIPVLPFSSSYSLPFRPDTNITLLFADTALASISGPSRPTPNRYACGVPSVKGGSQTFPEDCKDTKKQTKILLCA